ncbi:hypothetical protein AN958_02164 [Leucoagaricus sp. SymC.cos]|nr:hypothetical protein AN958_02164 [Leucoagaricus sp. SymC.cos]
MSNGVWNDHFYATSSPEIGAAGPGGFVEELPAGYVFLTQVPGTTPLYRCFFPAPANDHFHTANKAEFDEAVSNGCQPVEPVSGTIGFLYSRRVCGAIPLYRVYNPITMDHFYTSNKAERDTAVSSGGYKSEGIVGYVLRA